MIRRFSKKRQDTRRFYRINERIFASTLRVLDQEGKQIGVLSRSEALKKAKEMQVDLVEIAPMANPPVVKIISKEDAERMLEALKNEEKKRSKVSETKEIRLGPFMNDHDLKTMIRRGTGFLDDNDKVRLIVKFMGRQIAHPEFGKTIMQRVVDALSGMSKLEREPHFEGKQLIAILSPSKGDKRGATRLEGLPTAHSIASRNVS